MSDSAAVPRPDLVLADILPGRLVRDAGVVAASVVVIGIAAQIAVPLPFTPVPLTAQTFAVLVTGAALGPLRGTVSTLLYLIGGMAGVPWFTEHSSGWSSPSLGYVVGFVLAAVLTGALARRKADRSPVRTFGAMVLGNLAIYAVGVPWLMATAHLSLGQALALGVAPFLLGDALKALLAAALLPATWCLVGQPTD